MVIAILAPEIIILWAMLQWYSAKKVAKQFEKYGWGMSHAFFVIMGGFTLYDGDTFCGYLWNDNQDVYPYTFWEYCQVCNYDVDLINENRDKWHDEYQEKAKEYSQTIRMHLQKAHSPQENTLMSNAANTNQSQESINLLERGTPEPLYLLEYFLQKGYITITEDEIKDRSHTDFITKSIALIQTTWLILQVAARAAEHLAITELEIITVGFALLNFGTYIFWWNKPLRVQYPIRVTWQQQELDASQLKKDDGGCMKTIQKGFTEILDYICNEPFANGVPLAFQLILLPLWMTWNIISRSIDLFSDGSYTDEFPTRLEEVPPQFYITVYSIAAAFGAIHCIPWSFQFPTYGEQLLWQICAVAVAAAPIVMGCVYWWQKKLWDVTPDWLIALIFSTASQPIIFYIFCRLTLIILTLTALRDLSPSAYQTVQWITFVPHIG
ncbi:hypothetical protein Moror_17156 [Moniliophthora roreri MCA 2997]|uniref:Uncharacterized protein n=2 Tax=Moniliophthora roreri TaxID=221103 RepID=V2Y0M7_MONRO|nr:hypothetical protein Moror_17156 [Moniliophthora roreri MCA 2997]